MVWPVLDAVAQHVDDAALADLALQAGEELAPRGAVVVEVEYLSDLWLRGPKESSQLDKVHAVFALVVI